MRMALYCVIVNGVTVSGQVWRGRPGRLIDHFFLKTRLLKHGHDHGRWKPWVFGTWAWNTTGGGGVGVLQYSVLN